MSVRTCMYIRMCRFCYVALFAGETCAIIAACLSMYHLKVTRTMRAPDIARFENSKGDGYACTTGF